MINGHLAVFESPIVVDQIDVRSRRRRFVLHRGGIFSLQHQVQPAMTIIDQNDVGQSVVVQIARQHVGRTFRQLEDLDRLESVILGERRFFGRRMARHQSEQSEQAHPSLRKLPHVSRSFRHQVLSVLHSNLVKKFISAGGSAIG